MDMAYHIGFMGTALDFVDTPPAWGSAELAIESSWQIANQMKMNGTPGANAATCRTVDDAQNLWSLG